MQTTDFDHDNDTATLRWTADMLRLWALCGKPACRRARQCRRDPVACTNRYTALVPQAAGCGFAMLADGKLLGLSYEDVRAQAPEEIAAYEDWLARTGRATRTKELGSMNAGRDE